nr:hypothetical protein CFP56_26746 [Quercus suber]
MLCRYIGVLFGEMKRHIMPVSPAPYIPSGDPPIRRRSSSDGIGPSASLVVGDDANDSSTRHFASDTVRDDDFP